MSEEVKSLIPAVQAEEIMLQKDATITKHTDPLDTLSTFFYLYIFRFKNQVKMMKKKQLIKLADTLVGSEYTKQEEVNTLLSLLDSLNVNSIIRTINNAIESPLNENEIKSMSKKEKKCYDLLYHLLSEKYVSSIENVKEDDKMLEIGEIVKHTYNQKEFDGRDKVEKDAFATANKLIYTKITMIRYTLLEQVKVEENNKELKGEKNG